MIWLILDHISVVEIFKFLLEGEGENEVSFSVLEPNLESIIMKWFVLIKEKIFIIFWDVLNLKKVG